MLRFAAVLLALLSATTARAAEVIVCFGDSLTAGLGLSEDQAYPAHVEKLAKQEGLDWRIVNAGVSGDTTAAGLRRVEWVLRAKPTVVFIALGANDGLRSIDPDKTTANLLAIIDKITAKNIRVCLAGMQVPTNYGEEYGARFAAIFPDVAKEKNVPLMPFLLASVGGHQEFNQGDGIHPNAEGQALVARDVFTFLKKIIAEPSQAK
jgi:acyl-CoA thioesterase I